MNIFTWDHLVTVDNRLDEPSLCLPGDYHLFQKMLKAYGGWRYSSRHLRNPSRREDFGNDQKVVED